MLTPPRRLLFDTCSKLARPANTPNCPTLCRTLRDRLCKSRQPCPPRRRLHARWSCARAPWMTERLAKFPATATMPGTDVHGGAWEYIILAHVRKGASKSREASSQSSPATATAAKPSSARGRLADSAAIPADGHGERAARTGHTKTGLQRASACEFHGEKDMQRASAKCICLERKMFCFGTEAEQIDFPRSLSSD